MLFFCFAAPCGRAQHAEEIDWPAPSPEAPNPPKSTASTEDNNGGQLVSIRIDNQSGEKASNPPTSTVSTEDNSGDELVRIRIDNRSGEKVGLDVVGVGANLRIEAITPGIIQAWNEENPNQQVQVNDLITSVNDICGSIDSQPRHKPLLNAIRARTFLDLIIVRDA